MTTRVEIMWCTLCGVRITQEEVEGWGCPKCGNQGVPCDTAQDVRVEVNWHELRILTIWAENYAQRCAANPSPGEDNANMPDTVAAIARRLQRQHPTLTPLTLAEEVAELPQKVEGVSKIETHNIGRPKPIPVNGPGAVGYSKDPPVQPDTGIREAADAWLEARDAMCSSRIGSQDSKVLLNNLSNAESRLSDIVRALKFRQHNRQDRDDGDRT